jgi:hypothetical protein
LRQADQYDGLEDILADVQETMKNRNTIELVRAVDFNRCHLK